MKHEPTCRYCGTRVDYFGDLCSPCEGGRDGLADGTVDAARADSYALSAHMAAEDY